MPVQDDDFFAALFREFFQAVAEVDFFGCEEFEVEAADFAEGVGAAKDEGAGAPFANAADPIPHAREAVGKEMAFVHADNAAAGHAAAALNLFGDVGEEFGGGVGVGVDEDEPIAGGDACSGVSGAGDLVDFFGDDFRSSGSRDVRGFIG